jgi:hypothetical protein
MFLIRTDDPAALEQIAAEVDALTEFPHCDLGELNSLGLAEIHPQSVKWFGEPVVNDEAGGLAVFGLKPAAVTWLVKNADMLADFGADADALRKFGDGRGAVYAVDTF